MFKVSFVAYLVKLDHIGVSDFLQDLDLPGNSLNIFVVLYHFFLENFYGYLKRNGCLNITCSCK